MSSPLSPNVRPKTYVEDGKSAFVFRSGRVGRFYQVEQTRRVGDNLCFCFCETGHSREAKLAGQANETRIKWPGLLSKPDIQHVRTLVFMHGAEYQTLVALAQSGNEQVSRFVCWLDVCNLSLKYERFDTLREPEIPIDDMLQAIGEVEF
jgi:hypothetical protein